MYDCDEYEYLTLIIKILFKFISNNEKIENFYLDF